MLAGGSKANRPDLILHEVKLENLDLTVVERGTLESSVNKDVTCLVKASKGGNFATTIKNVIDDGSEVKEGQPICTLDSAALEDQLRTQIIAVTTAEENLIIAKGTQESVELANVKLLTPLENAVEAAELNIEQYVGVPRGTLGRLTLEKRVKYVAALRDDIESFLAKHRDEFPKPDGDYQSLLDDVNGRISKAEADQEQWKDRSNYSQRMAIKGYVTQSQAQSDESNLNSATEALKKVRTEKRQLQIFVAQKAVKTFCSQLKEAEAALASGRIDAKANVEKANKGLEAKTLVLEQEREKLKEIQEQIRICHIRAPQDGLVVYYTPEQSRFGGGSQQSIVAQGEPVREGQKLMRIPNLRKMQVVARVHEAMISRIKGDVIQPTGISQGIHAASMINLQFLPQLALLKDEAIEPVKQKYHDREFEIISQGQPSRVRVDAFADHPLSGHVKSKATVASQDFFTNDVKVYQTVVAIDEYLDGLRPGMSAEVTIQIENPLEQVLAVPVQAIMGGPELGDKRKVFVMTGDGPQEREVRVGLTNDKMAEIRDGLGVGDHVVTNPKVLLGDKAKTRENETKEGGKGKGKGKGGKGGGPK
jgi:HlyD family secretion protein